MKQIISIAIIILGLSMQSNAQNIFDQNKIIAIHSHNDYHQKEPLIGALEATAKSIEIDVFLKNDKVLVGHVRSELSDDKSLEKMYILPLKKHLETHPGYDFFFMIDVKTEAVSTLNAIDNILKKYPELFSENGIQIVISGSRPKPENYNDYAPYIWFDGRNPSDVETSGGNKIALISQDFSSFTSWRGKGDIPQKDLEKLELFIKECHNQHRAVRLWDTGDSNEMRDFLISIGVDYLNSDTPKETRQYIQNKIDLQ